MLRCNMCRTRITYNQIDNVMWRSDWFENPSWRSPYRYIWCSANRWNWLVKFCQGNEPGVFINKEGKNVAVRPVWIAGLDDSVDRVPGKRFRGPDWNPSLVWSSNFFTIPATTVINSWPKVLQCIPTCNNGPTLSIWCRSNPVQQLDQMIWF